MRRRRNKTQSWGGFSGFPLEYRPTAELPTMTVVRRGRRVVVQAWEQGLLFRHGQFVEVLGPGGYRYWSSGYALRSVDARPWTLTVPAQEVPSADGVSVKVTVAGQVHIADPLVHLTASQDSSAVLYLAIQIALRETLARHTVEELLTARAVLGEELVASVRGADELGLTVDRLEVKDIIVPGELKRAQAAVVVARAEALATLERARGETATLRNLANAAQLIAQNPALYQLRLLQQLAATSGHTVVIGTQAVPAPSPPDASPPNDG
jgi:regulator of protease activity HflC (stomatin/prohibitin superfamily)